MKILLCTLEYPPQIGGVANYYGNLIQAWPRDDSWDIIDNSQNSLLAPKGFWLWRRSLSALKRQISRFKPDFVFIGQILPLGSAALILSFFLPIKYGIFLHGMDLSFALRSPRKRLLARLVLKKARVIVCANSRVQSLLFEFMPALAARTILIHPGANPAGAVPALQDSIISRYGLKGKKIIFSIGRLVKRKGFDQVIKSLDKVEGDNWLYLLAGDGPEKDNLKKLAAASKQKEKIIFLGPLSDEEKWSCLDLCDIFVMTSRDLAGDFEGFGIVYLEANLMGKPVIAGASGGVADAVIHEGSGLLVDPENPEEISEAINRLLSNSALALNLGRQGKIRAQTDFSWEKQARKLFEYLHLYFNL